MVVSTADEAIANAKSWDRCDAGMCLYTVQEWFESGHAYPDAAEQWAAAKYKHTDDDPPAGFPVFWTGGGHGYGHVAISLGDSRIRSTDCTTTNDVSDCDLSWPRTHWGLTYAGWTEDLAGTRLPYSPGTGPSNPNDIETGDLAIVTANGLLNGRAEPDMSADVIASLAYGVEFDVIELLDGWAFDEDTGAWYSTDYLYPRLPNPDNPNGIQVSDTAVVTASGLNARILPGGPQRIDDTGQPLVRPNGWSFEVLDLVDGWAGGGTNWYSCDYLDVTAADIPFGWGSGPSVTLDDPTPDPNRNVSYLQGVVRVAAMTDSDGQHHDAVYVVGQDYGNSGDLRFGLMRADGVYTDEWMQVNDGGHGQCFHAYRSAAGNLYVWCGEDPAYRYKWQPGKKVAKSSGDKMDYKGGRPVGSYEPWVGFRNATDTKETLSLFDRTDFTDGTNRSTPAKEVTIAKRTDYTQQTWAVSEDRIFRLYGSTNQNPGSGKNLHILDVYSWAGTCLGTFDLTAMTVDTTSDEPEGLTFTGTPGDLMAGKREGSTDPAKRSYPIWTVVGLP